jgi:hypothetical protein
VVTFLLAGLCLTEQSNAMIKKIVNGFKRLNFGQAKRLIVIDGMKQYVIAVARGDEKEAIRLEQVNRDVKKMACKVVDRIDEFQKFYDAVRYEASMQVMFSSGRCPSLADFETAEKNLEINFADMALYNGEEEFVMLLVAAGVQVTLLLLDSEEKKAFIRRTRNKVARMKKKFLDKGLESLRLAMLPSNLIVVLPKALIDLIIEYFGEDFDAGEMRDYLLENILDS